MKINDIYESTTSGSVATVASPMTTQSRNASIYGGKKGGNLLSGKKTNKKYANSIHESEEKFKVQIICDDGGKTSYTVAAKDKEEALRKATKFANRDGYEDFEAKIITESKMKQVAMDLETMQDGNFKQKYGKTKDHIRMLLGDPGAKKTMHEAHLEEDDLILVPGQGRTRKTGFIKHGESRLDHEVSMARSDLFSAAKNAKQVYEMIADLSEEKGLEGWVQEKIIKANDYLNTVREYLEGKQVQEMSGGVIAGRGVEEGIVDKIKGAVRREKAKDLPLLQTRRDYATMKAGDEYAKGEPRKGSQYMAWAERDRKKKGDPSTNPMGTYRTKTSDYSKGDK